MTAVCKVRKEMTFRMNGSGTDAHVTVFGRMIADGGVNRQVPLSDF